MSKLAHVLHTKIDSAMTEFMGQSFVRETITQMKEIIQSLVIKTFNDGAETLGPKAVSWLTNQFLRNVKGKDEDGEFLLSEVVLFNDYELSELKHDDVVLLESTFRDEAFCKPLTEFLKKARS